MSILVEQTVEKQNGTQLHENIASIEARLNRREANQRNEGYAFINAERLLKDIQLLNLSLEALEKKSAESMRLMRVAGVNLEEVTNKEELGLLFSLEEWRHLRQKFLSAEKVLSDELLVVQGVKTHFMRDMVLRSAIQHGTPVGAPHLTLPKRMKKSI